MVRGVVAALALASLVLAVGWVVPIPEAELRPLAANAVIAALVAAFLVPLWPEPRRRRVADLDSRLRFGDRLNTAWSFRAATNTLVRLQRADAIRRLAKRSPAQDLTWRPARAEIWALAATAAIAALLVIVPSPQQAKLDQQAAEQVAVEQASERLEGLRQEVVGLTALTPEQTRQLDELLRQAQAELNQTHTQREASAVLARAQDQIGQQLGDPNADLRDEALAAMSETLAAEPRTQGLGDALASEDARATSDALRELAAQADQLSDVERQALSRALQRAANVGRSDPRAASALRDAAQAIAGSQPSDAALGAADAALREAIQASQAQAALNATTQRLRDLQTQVASGTPSSAVAPRPLMPRQDAEGGGANAAGTPVALNAGGLTQLQDPSAGQSQGAGYGASGVGSQGQAALQGEAAENVFVPGRIGNGPAGNQDLVDQPFTVRGAPRPYRDVLGQYAPTARDYVDRPDISPAVRDLVKQYFQELEEGQ